MQCTHQLLVTGGAGFIGSHLVRRLARRYPQYHIINIDALTYAGNLANLDDIAHLPNYTFVHGDICNADLLQQLFTQYSFDGVIHLAAESHVDRSISHPLSFVQTNVLGTVNLLNACRDYWKDNFEGKRFYQVSTDEVYGSLGETGFFVETTAYDPRSPYSASKAAADHFVRAYHHTYQIPVLLSNCSNNYGAYQFPEKLLPLAINNIKNNKPVPVYGDGQYTRDWLWVEDHAAAIDLIYHKGKIGDTYNVGGYNEWKNIDLLHELCAIMDELLQRPANTSIQLLTFVKDRPGHDRRYAIDASKITRELGWKPSVTFQQGLRQTAAWYIANETWLREITSGDYQQYYKKQYGKTQ